MKEYNAPRPHTGARRAGRVGTRLRAMLALSALLGAIAVVVPATSASAGTEAKGDTSRTDTANTANAVDTANAAEFVVSEAQFNRMFPNRNSFYTYAGLIDAMNSYPAFAHTGSETVKKQEAAAFLANVSHETAGLVYIVEQNESNYPHYCDESQPYGCPAGQAAYYGRGPIQLSWNFNYKAAGDALGIDLLNNPYMVERNPSVAWQTALWYWMTQKGPGTMPAHEAMVEGHGFGETIRAINGALECDGGNPRQVQSRIDKYKEFVRILGTVPGDNLRC